MSVKELTVKDFDKGLPHVPKNVGNACAVLFKLNGCHWCEKEQEVFDRLNSTIGFMNLYTFTTDGDRENPAHWNKIKKSLKNSKDLNGFPIIMLYSPSGKVVVYVGFEDYDEMKQKMISFMDK